MNYKRSPCQTWINLCTQSNHLSLNMNISCNRDADDICGVFVCVRVCVCRSCVYIYPSNECRWCQPLHNMYALSALISSNRALTQFRTIPISFVDLTERAYTCITYIYHWPRPNYFKSFLRLKFIFRCEFVIQRYYTQKVSYQWLSFIKKISGIGNTDK